MFSVTGEYLRLPNQEPCSFKKLIEAISISIRTFFYSLRIHFMENSGLFFKDGKGRNWISHPEVMQERRGKVELRRNHIRPELIYIKNNNSKRLSQQNKQTFLFFYNPKNAPFPLLMLIYKSEFFVCDIATIHVTQIGIWEYVFPQCPVETRKVGRLQEMLLNCVALVTAEPPGDAASLIFYIQVCELVHRAKIRFLLLVK